MKKIIHHDIVDKEVDERYEEQKRGYAKEKDEFAEYPQHFGKNGEVRNACGACVAVVFGVEGFTDKGREKTYDKNRKKHRGKHHDKGGAHIA